VAVSQPAVRIPDANHPLIRRGPNGESFVDPVWHRYLSDLTALLNALRTEVNTQHP
jgi:hypothetical protein